MVVLLEIREEAMSQDMEVDQPVVAFRQLTVVSEDSEVVLVVQDPL